MDASRTANTDRSTPTGSIHDPDTHIPVFFADDHALIRNTLSEFMTSHYPGLEIIESATYEDMVSSILDYQTNRPERNVGKSNDANGANSLILMDLNMPGVMVPKSLYNLTQQFPDIPIIILSGLYTADEVYSMMKFGVRALVPKTANPKLLLHVISLVLDGESYFPADVTIKSKKGNGVASSLAAMGSLSKREIDVALLVGDGLTNKEIARVLGNTEGTVKVNMKSLFRKLEINNRTLLAKLLFDLKAQEPNTSGP